MARVRQKGTAPELAVRSMVHAMGYRFRLHDRDLPGSPDLVFRRMKKVLFVHGCFWHRHQGCARASMPKTRTRFWAEKFAANIRRDEAAELRLRELGWQVEIVWECEVADRKRLLTKLAHFLSGPTLPPPPPPC
jgi:DNA mismatch endonuclease (patch repair protein)